MALRGSAGEGHGGFEFGAQNIDYVFHPVGPTNPQTIKNRTAEQTRRSRRSRGLLAHPFRDEFHCPSDGNAPGDFFGDGGQGVDGGRHGVETAAAVVRDDDAGGAVFAPPIRRRSGFRTPLSTRAICKSREPNRGRTSFKFR